MKTNVIVCCLAGTVLASCGAKGSFNPPPIAPIVNAALPNGLKLNTTATQAKMVTPGNAPAAEMPQAAHQIAAMFSEYYVSPNDGQGYQGYVNNLVLAIDKRMQGVSQQVSSEGSAPKCLSAAPSSHAFDLSAIDPMLKITSPYLQCRNFFSTGGASGPGSGTAFGSDGNNYSLWLYLAGQGNTTTYDQLGGFFAAANVVNYGSSNPNQPETVDGVLVAYSPAAANNAISIARFRASSSTQTFALFLASNEVSTAGGAAASTSTAGLNDSGFGSGLRLISDGQHVYADGLMLDTNTNTYYNFNVCLNANDLSLDSNAATDCNSLANDYVTTTWASLYGASGDLNPLATSPTLTYNEVTGCNATLPTGTQGLPATYPQSNACNPNVAPPGNGTPNRSQTSPGQGVLSALSTLALPSSGLQDL